MRKSFHQILSIFAIYLLFSQTILGSLPAFAQTNSNALAITMTENGQPYVEGSVATNPVTIQVVITSPDSASIELSQDLGTTWEPYDPTVPLLLEEADDYNIWFRGTDGGGQPVIEKRHIQITTAAFLSTQGTSVTTPASATIYVNEKSPAGNGGDGKDWLTAYKDLQVALKEAVAGQEIWIAAGTYKPTELSNPADPRTASFQMKNGVAIYGSFAGGETTAAERDARDFKANKTILSGDIGTDGDNTDNAYHVFYHPSSLNLDASAILDGVTITGGNANGGSYPHNTGGGMFNVSSSPTVTNVEFIGNTAINNGGGMYNWNSSPTVTNVEFIGNTATKDGGGMYNDNSSSPTVTNVEFGGNKAVYGGGMFNHSSNPTVTNVEIIGNKASIGGGMYNQNSNPTVTNVEFSGNKASTGGGMSNRSSNPTLTNVTMSGNITDGSNRSAIYNNSGTPKIHNSTIVGNSGPAIGGNSATIENSLLGDAKKGQLYNGAGKPVGTDYKIEDIFISPNLPDPTKADYRLKAGSPAIDKGENLDNTTLTDLYGNLRIQGCVIDLGAYESQGTVTCHTVTFESNGGSAIASQTVSDNTLAQEPTPAPTMPGHTFAGWYQDSVFTSTSVWDFKNDLVKGNITLYAKWDVTQVSPIIYVNGASTGTVEDGKDWSTAYKDLQTALKEAVAGQEIWIAKGTYKTTSGTDRTISFQMKNGVAIYGGFVGNETTAAERDARDFKKNVTILSGDIGVAGNEDNAYHVFYHNGLNLDASAILDGVTITGGNANGSSYPHNNGGGMYNHSSNPTVTNVKFSGNEAAFGGGMSNFSSSPTVTNVEFSGNRASYGGGMSNSSSSPTLTNVTMSGNITNVSNNSAIDNIISSVPKIQNSIIVGNNGPAYNETPTIKNSLIGDSQKGQLYDGTGKSDRKDHLLENIFIDPTKADYRLKAGSPAIDKGDSSYPELAKITKDLDGNPRKLGAEIDLGAYEYQVSVISHTVTFESNGGSTITSQTVSDNTLAQEPTLAPTKAGHTFAGWYKDSAFTSVWDFKNDLVKGNITLYAKWEANPTYTVTYNGNGATVGNVPSSEMYEENATVTVRGNSGHLEKTGYTFTGWNTQKDGQGTAYAENVTFLMGTANITLYAQWTTNAKPTYTVTYNGNGATGGQVPVDTKTYETGVNVKVADNTDGLVKTGYTFTGWNTQDDGKGTDYAEKATFPMGVSNVTLYAQWKANAKPAYSVTYDGNGATGGQVPVDTNKYETGVNVKVADNTNGLVKTGYTFTGWNTQKDGQGTAYAEKATFLMGATHITLYAQWTANAKPMYTVTFESNGGSAVAPQNVAHQTLATRPAVPTKAGYTFAGWYQDTALTKAWDFAKHTVTAPTTLYAKWVENNYSGSYSPDPNPGSYTLTFESNGGSMVAIQSIFFNDKSKEPPAPTKAGYTFAGWYKDAALTKAWDFTKDTLTETTTLYAKWIVNSTLPEQPTPIEPTPEEPEPTITFNDISTNWAKEMIEDIAARGIIKGYPDGSFRPNEPIQRQHVAVMLARAFELAAQREVKPFSDVPTNHPNYEVITNLQQAGIIDGSDGAFNPNESLTRAQLAKILVLALGLTPGGTSLFQDVPTTHWSHEYIAVLADYGIALGDNGNFNPNEPVTRAQFAAFMYRALNL